MPRPSVNFLFIKKESATPHARAGAQSATGRRKTFAAATRGRVHRLFGRGATGTPRGHTQGGQERTTIADERKPETRTGKRGGATIGSASDTQVPAAVTAGGVDLPDAEGGGGADGGLEAMDVATDVAGKLDSIAPTFGEILKSVGTGVAAAQRALDASVVATARRLADTKIDVVTDVIQRINDDTGLPEAPNPDTDLVKQQLSVLNFVTPTVHEWKYVALSMDLTVAGFNEKTGMSFNSFSMRAGQGSAGAYLGFVGVGSTSLNSDFSTVRATIERESEWAEGQVQLDSLLAPRRTTKFPVPASVEVGPQIFVTQGRTTDVRDGTRANAPLVERQVEVTITILKANGEANGGRNPVIEAPGLLREAMAGGATNARGKVVYRLRRFYGRPAPFASFPVTVRLGAIVRRFAVDL